MEITKEKWNEIADLVCEGVQTDGGHHKQWYLEQVAEKLGIELEEHEEGIPG
jgi:hypothetical protein